MNTCTITLAIASLQISVYISFSNNYERKPATVYAASLFLMCSKYLSLFKFIYWKFFEIKMLFLLITYLGYSIFSINKSLMKVWYNTLKNLNEAFPKISNIWY